jgi:hypothetical protein
MSYRNPKQFIDTQTGQHYRNLIKSVTKTGDDLAKRIVARNAEVAERNNKIISDADKKEQAILQQFGNVTAGNPAFNYGEGFARYIDEYSDLNIAVNTGTSQNPQAARQRMAEIESLPVMARQGLEGLIEMTDNFIEKANNRGRMGGLDLPGVETEDLKSFLILADQLKGSRSFEVVEENGKLVPAYSLGDRMWTYTQIENYLNNDIAGGAFNVIPDETESFTKAAELAMIPDPQNPENKILDPKYYENEDEVEGKPDSKGNRVFYRPLDINALKKAPIGQMLKADGSSMTNADKISFWNNILSTEDNWAYGEPLSSTQLKDFEEAYIEYGLRNYLRQENDARIVEPPKPEEVEAPKTSELKLEAFEELIDTKGGKEKIYRAFVTGPGANVADQISLMLQDLAIPNEVLQVQDNEGNVDQDLIRIDVAGREGKIDIDITKPDMAVAKLKYAISGDYSHVRELQKQN